ncbi:hypothetical protein Tco_1056842 [Tanacetum coccineum]|uniref:Uncharacterized protein n=1 Tax=Tanacetum coccineum TaxID=301880 RepID=A0ABQ5H560_9ASTR
MVGPSSSVENNVLINNLDDGNPLHIQTNDNSSTTLIQFSCKPIRRIHQGRYGVSVPALTKDHKRNEDQYAVSRGLNTPYSRYGINIIFWKISNVVPTPRNPQYAVSNTWIRRDLDNSTNNILIPLDSWTSGLLVYRLPLSDLKLETIKYTPHNDTSTNKEKVKSLALKAKFTREQTSDDSDSHGDSDEDVDKEEEAEAFI